MNTDDALRTVTHWLKLTLSFLLGIFIFVEHAAYVAMTRVAIPEKFQTLVLLLIDVLLIVVILRLFGGFIRLLLILLLILLVLHILSAGGTGFAGVQF